MTQFQGSPLHVMLATVTRETDPHHLNRIINHPDVDKWVRGYALGKLDAAGLIADPAVIVLGGQFGALVFRQIMPGLYEVHVQCLPEGRGEWMTSFSQAAMHWMMCFTDAMEIIGPVPQGNIAVKAWARSMGFRHRFTSPKKWVQDLDPISCDVVSVFIHDWIETAPGLSERGSWCLGHIADELARHGQPRPEWQWPGDADQHRFLGMTMEMLLGGQHMKALIFHNRWAVLSGRPILNLVTLHPLLVDIGGVQIMVRPDKGDFWIPAVK